MNINADDPKWTAYVLGELDAAFGIHGHLETEDAGEAPGRVGDRLDQIGFVLADGLELILVGADVALMCIS